MLYHFKFYPYGIFSDGMRSLFPENRLQSSLGKITLSPKLMVLFVSREPQCAQEGCPV